jgi:hypothetical protein
MPFSSLRRIPIAIAPRAPSFRRLVPLIAVAITLSLGSAARAGVVTTTLGTAGPGYFAVLGLGGTTVAIPGDGTDISLTGPGQTTGNVGVASDGKLSLSSSTPPAIIGDVYLGNTATINGNQATQIQGTVFTNQDVKLNQAVADAVAAAGVFQAMANTFTVAGGSITGPMTITATQAVNVTHITDLQLSNGEVLTLFGTAGQEFVINISGDFKLNADATGGKILLAGGLRTEDVVFNITGTGSDVATSGGSSGGLPNAQINGIILTLDRKIAFAPGLVNGEIIGGGDTISLVSGSQVNGVAVPEPSTTVMALVVLVPVGIVGLRRRLRRTGEASA